MSGDLEARGPARGRGRAGRRRRATPRPGPRRPSSRADPRLRRARSRASATRAAAASGVRAFVGRPLGLRLRHRPQRRRPRATLARRGARGGRRGRPRRARRRCPTSPAPPPVDGPGLARAGATGRTERKVELALAVERAARARDGRDPGRGRASTPTPRARWRSPTRAASRPPTTSTQAWAYASAFAGEGADLMTGLGVGSAATPAALDPEAIGAEAAERALALVGARQPESRRCPVVLDAFVAASFVGFIGGDALGRRRAARPLAVRRAARARRWPTPALRAGRRRHRPGGPGAARRSTARASPTPAHAADRGRPAADASCSTPAPRAARARATTAQRRPRLLPHAALGRAPRTCCSSPGDGDARGAGRAAPATGST